MTNEDVLAERGEPGEGTAAGAAAPPPPNPFTTDLDEPVAALASDETATEPPGDDGREWFIVQTYSGYENKVKTSLEQRIQQMDMGDQVFEVVIPTEEEIEIRDGQRRTVLEEALPGLRARADADGRRLLVRRPQHPWRDRLRGLER